MMNDIELIDEIVKRAEEHQKQREKEFAIAELEKIKAEIDNPKTCMFAGTYEADWIMENIIDKHISELKGENDEI